MSWDLIKTKILEAIIHALVFGLGLVIIYSISLVLVGDIKFKKEREDTINRESEIIARVVVLENLISRQPTNTITPNVATVVATNKHIAVSPINIPVQISRDVIEDFKHVQEQRRQYKSDNLKKD